MRILRRFTDFLLWSRLQAMGVAFFFACIPMLGSIGVLIAGLVTLRKNALEGFLVVIATTAPYFLKYYLGNDIPEGEVDIAFIGLILSAVSNFLVWLFAVLLRRYNNWSAIIEYAVLLGIVVVGLAHLLYPDIQSWWGTQLNKYLNKTAAMVSGMQDATTDEKQAQAIQFMEVYATGMIVVSVLLNVLLQVVLARWWQAVIFNPGGLRQELHQVRLSHVFGILFIVGFGLSTFGNETVMDMMPILYVAFCAAGLSLAHSYIATMKNGWIWILLLYLIVLLWLLPFGIVIIAIMALLDVWMDFRKRFVRKT